MTQEEISAIQKYLREKFESDKIIVQRGGNNDLAPTEVLIGSEFIGAIYKNEDEGEISYDFMMSILEDDLEG